MNGMPRKLAPFRIWRLALIGAVVVIGLSRAPSHAGTALCPDTDITISGGSATDIALACAGVQDAASFLPTLGLALPERLPIEFVDAQSTREEWRSLGHFDARRNVVKLLSFDAAVEMTRRGGPFGGVAMNQALWRSYVVHELAHAATHRHVASPGVPFAAKEYIAAVAQFSTVAADTRRAILDNYPDARGFASGAQIREEFYLIDPCLFAVKSYLHYLDPENGPRFVSRLLDEEQPPLGTSAPPTGAIAESPQTRYLAGRMQCNPARGGARR